MACKVPLNIQKASKALEALLNAILDGYKNDQQIANLLGESRQFVQTFRKYGYVSLRSVYEVSKKLKVDPWALSYIKLYEVFGDKSKNLEHVLNLLNLPDINKVQILNLLNKKCI